MHTPPRGGNSTGTIQTVAGPVATQVPDAHGVAIRVGHAAPPGPRNFLARPGHESSKLAAVGRHAPRGLLFAAETALAIAGRRVAD
jgi:hypothetical protein